MQKIDFQKLDSRINFNARTKGAVFKIVEENKYKYVSQFAHHLYYKEKLPVYRVAERMDVSAECLKYWIAKWEFEMRVPKNKPLTPEKKEQILSLKKTHNAKNAAKECNCSITMIRKVWGPARKKVASRPPAKKHTGEKAEHKQFFLSTWKSRGLSKETWETNNRMLELERWRKHKDDKPMPLPEKTMRIGEYQNF